MAEGFTLKKAAEAMNARRFEFSAAELGLIRVGYPDSSNTSDLRERIGDLESASATKVASALLSVVGKRVVDGVSKSGEELPITPEEAQNVSEGELESFAEEFVKRNKNWLLIDLDNTHVSFRTGEDGKQTQVHEIRSAELPKGEGENSVEHLKRVISFYLKEEGRKFERLTGLNSQSLKNLSAGMPQDVRRLMADNRNIAGRLGESVARDHLSDIRSTFREISIMRDPAAMRSEHQARLTARTNEHLDTLIENLGDLQPVVTNSAGLLQNMNALGLNLAAQFGASSAESSRQNRRMLKVALWTLIVSVALTAIGLFLSYRSYHAAVDANAQSKAFTDAIVDQSKLMREMYSSSVLLGERNKRLNDLVRQQALALEQFKKFDPRAPEAKALAIRLQELNGELSRKLTGINDNIKER
jgi:hypothetical protein